VDGYNRSMAKLKSVSPEAAAELERTEYQWARSIFTLNFKNHCITNKLSESMMFG